MWSLSGGESAEGNKTGGPLAVGTPALSPQLHGPLSAVGTPAFPGLSVQWDTQTPTPTANLLTHTHACMHTHTHAHPLPRERP